MKIKRLRLAGFGPYKDEQSVDLEAFDADGIFLITGKTGAGKSSILDAICYALYNAVPRYDGGQSKLRSDHAAPDDPTFVELEFSVGTTDYRVVRTPDYEKPKQRGTGMTTAPPTAFLSQRVGEEWEGIAAKPVDVGNALHDILGLTKDQFLQVILLAQNRFQQFLRAGNDERQGVLRSLFGTSRFQRLEESLLASRKVLETELAAVHATLALLAAQAAATLRIEPPTTADPDWFAAQLAAITADVDNATHEAEKADAALAELDAEYRLLTLIQERQQRRTTAAAALVRLSAETDAIDGARLTVADAAKASIAWPYVTASRAASTALETARVAESAARDDYPHDPAGVTTRIGELTRQLGALDDVVAEEKRLPTLEVAVVDAQGRLDRALKEQADAAASVAGIPSELGVLAAELTAARVTAGGRAAADDAVTRAAAVLEAARSATTLAAEAATADTVELEATRAHHDASTALKDLTERRLAGHAAELATELTPGEPCAVCGSTSHPAPATADAEPVSRADVDRAHERVTERAAALENARTAGARVQRSLAKALVLSDGLTVEHASAAHDSAKAAQQLVTDAVVLVSTLEVQQAELSATLDASAEIAATLATQRDAASDALVEATTRRDASVARIEGERGDSESVSARVKQLESDLAAAQALLDAVTAVAARETELATASAALTAQLAEHSFADEAAVELARTPRPDVERFESTIRAHDTGLATARATLAEPELADLPVEPIVVDDTALVERRQVRDATLGVRSSLTERATEVARVVASAEREAAASVDLQREYDDIRELAAVVHGEEPNTMRMKLETYVLAAQLEEIVAAANARLKVMTGGRFTLLHDDSLQYRKAQSGLGLAILDEHTGRARATHSLSGGETFLASLALALGLAEVVTNQAGGITLDTLFIDEGFGSLDAATLEIAMSTLDSLRAGGRTIGLISHVDSMKEQITARLQVEVTAQGDSRIAPVVSALA